MLFLMRCITSFAWQQLGGERDHNLCFKVILFTHFGKSELKINTLKLSIISYSLKLLLLIFGYIYLLIVLSFHLVSYFFFLLKEQLSIWPISWMYSLLEIHSPTSWILLKAFRYLCDVPVKKAVIELTSNYCGAARLVPIFLPSISLPLPTWKINVQKHWLLSYRTGTWSSGTAAILLPSKWR